MYSPTPTGAQNRPSPTRHHTTDVQRIEAESER